MNIKACLFSLSLCEQRYAGLANTKAWSGVGLLPEITKHPFFLHNLRSSFWFPDGVELFRGFVGLQCAITRKGVAFPTR